MEDNKSAGVPDWNGQVLSGKKKEIFFVPYLTRPHGLRHMFATSLLERGVSLPKVSSLLGHGSINTTFEYYVGIMEETEKIIAYINDEFQVEE